MRFLHLSDLHIGRRVHEISMIENQRFVFAQITDIIKKEKIEAVVIAGDIYDKSVPPTEAVGVFDDFLTDISALDIPVLIISGNHDSAERLSYVSRLLKEKNIHICSAVRTSPEKVHINGVDFYLLPFMKPSYIRQYADCQINNYDDMMKFVLKDFKRENPSVLVAHQFITCSSKETERCESEFASVGGLDNIDSGVFDGFDYVALGHIHGAQSVGAENIRYCGTLLKYSFSEVKHNKAALVVDIDNNGAKTYNVPVKPLHEMREIRGTMEEIARHEKSEDYVYVTLTDKECVINPLERVRNVYPNVMKLDTEYAALFDSESCEAAENIEAKNPCELFEEFFAQVTNAELGDEEKELILNIFEEIESDEA